MKKGENRPPGAPGDPGQVAAHPKQDDPQAKIEETVAVGALHQCFELVAGDIGGPPRLFDLFFDGVIVEGEYPFCMC